MIESSPTLEERVARQETAEEARGLIAAYGLAIDSQDPAALSRIFAPVIVLSAGERSFRGLDEVLGFYTEYWSSHPVVRRHFITNVAITELSPTTAVARSYFMFLSAVDTTPMIGWGTYLDTFERDDGELKFTAKQITVELDVDVRTGWASELGRAAT